MKSPALGKSTSTKLEILNISQHGIWIYVTGKEFFLSYKTYPWFKEARINEIYKVKLVRNRYLTWPDLDVDLSLESLEHPERFPLVSKK